MTIVRWERTVPFVATQRPGEVVKRLERSPRTTPEPGPTGAPVPTTIRKAEPGPYVSNRDWARAKAETLAAELRRADPRLTERAALSRVYARHPALARFATGNTQKKETRT